MTASRSPTPADRWKPAGPIHSRGMFDGDGNALPVIEVFDRFTRGRQRDDR